MMSFIQVSAFVQEFVQQDLLALAFFLISFYLWKLATCTFGKQGKASKQSGLWKAPSKKGHAEAFLKPAYVAKRATGNGPTARHELSPQRIQDAQYEILRLLELREFTSALNRYRAFEREGLDQHFTSEDMYSGFIQSAVRVGKIDVVERMLRTMVRNSITPSVQFWHSTLKLMSSRKHFSCSLGLYAMYGYLLPDDKVIFSCLINAALESGAPERALPMLDRYRQCCLEPSDYVTAFRVYAAAAGADEAEKLVIELGASMTPLMLNLALLTCINAGQPDRANSLLVKAHELETKTFEQDVRIVDTVSYNTVIKGFTSVGDLGKCLECIRRMGAHSLKPDDVTLASLLDISFTDKKHAFTDQLVKLLVDGVRDETLDSGTCNLFIKSLIGSNRLEKALEVYEALKICRCAQPNIVTYSTLIKSLAHSHDLERALMIVEDMQSRGEMPDEIIFSHLLDGCRLVGNQALGERLFDDMIAAGVRPSEYTLTMMVKLHGRYGAHEKAHQLVASWETKYGMKPSVIHYTCLMSGSLRARRVDQAWAAYELMQQHGVSPDATMVTTLLPPLVAAREHGRVLRLAERALRQPGGAAVVEALKSALRQMSLEPSAEGATQELRRLLQAAGAPVEARGARHKGDAANVASKRANAPWRVAKQ